MSGKTEAVSRFVENRIKQIYLLPENAAKAVLAGLRRGVGTAPGELPQLWGLLLQDLPEELMSKDGMSTRGQWAVYIALTLFALHQQGYDLKQAPMYQPGVGLGRAAARLIGKEEDMNRIQRRFNVLATSADIRELSHHLRGMVQLLRTDSIPLDYSALAKDLYLYQNEDYRAAVRLKWGQDFYTYTGKKEAETGKDEPNEEK